MLGRETEQVRTSKKASNGMTLNPTGSRPYWPEPRLAKIIPLELLTSALWFFVLMHPNWARISQTHVQFKIMLSISDIMLGVVVTIF